MHAWMLATIGVASIQQRGEVKRGPGFVVVAR
jgi:hypothetical protein